MIEQDLNHNDEYNNKYKDTKGYPIKEGNGAEATVDNSIPRRDKSITGVNNINMSLDGKSYGKYVHMQLFMKEKKQESMA